MISTAQFYGVACAIVLIGIVVACLWPFHSPANQVAWLEQRNGVGLGRYATIVSRGAIMPSDQPAPNAWTLEIWLRPGQTYQSNTILAFYNPERPRGLLLRQWNTDFLVDRRLWSRDFDDGTPDLGVGRVFREGRTVFLTLTSGPQGTSLYVDGNLIRVAPRLRVSGDSLSGQLVLANSPVDSGSWFGELRGLAFYSRALNEAQVFRHFATWTQTGRPDVTPNEEPAALYLFNEESGSIIHNQVLPGANL